MVGAGPDLISNEYTDVNDAALAATTSLSTLWLSRPTGPAIGKVADISAVYADFLGAGSKQDWMVGLETLTSPGGRGLLFRTDTTGTVTYYTVTANGWVNGGGYGASWTFRGSGGEDRIFFAANNGAGIFELDLGTVSLSGEGSTKGTGSFTVNKIGIDSASVYSNDGISCPTAYVPFPT